MLIFPNAKINLGLNVISKRPDGFHNIETVFYPVPLRDGLEAIEGKMSFTISGISLPGRQEENLCLKAYDLLKKDFRLPPLAIHLHKCIPAGAGLGGGSADAACMIRLINEKAGLGLGQASMEHYARQLGSDCAFFIHNKPVYAFEKGDVFKQLDVNLEGFYLLIIKPDIHISTADAYQNIIPGKPDYDLLEAVKLPVLEWKKLLRNDFEEALFPVYPVLEGIRSDLYKKGALYASMSGSGSAFYGIFEKEVSVNDYKEKGWLYLQAFLPGHKE